VKTIATNGVSPTSQFIYDPSNYRIGKTDSEGSKTYLLEGEHLDGIMSGDRWKAKYMRGAVIDEVVNGYEYDESGNWTNYTYHHDSLQSVLGLSGHEGSLLQTMQYEPFGDTIATTGTTNANQLHYTGREEDPDSGLYYYRARYYDPEIGRFITEDPKGFAAGINFYAYAGNNPNNYHDPLGLEKGDLLDLETWTDPELYKTAWQDVNSGAASGRIGDAALAVLGAFGGLGQMTFAAETGGVLSYPIAVHGAGNVAGSFGDYLNVVDGGNRDWNFTKNGYEAVGSAFGNESLGTAAFYTVDISSSLFMGFTGVSVEGTATLQNGVELQVFTKTPAILAQPVSLAIYDGVSLVNDVNSAVNDLSASASGGFVIYPNKSNLNQTAQVYAK
jgi:RHS repeat-associated protein